MVAGEAALKDDLPRIRLCCVHVSDHLRSDIRALVIGKAKDTLHVPPIFSHSTVGPAGETKTRKWSLGL